MEKTSNKMDKPAFLRLLNSRFHNNMHRHPTISWNDVVEHLNANPAKLGTILKMETSGGEPDVVVLNDDDSVLLFCDCSSESPIGRRGLCYDRAAWETRKANKPCGNAMEMAQEMGASLLNENEYRQLQLLENFDSKTSSWIATPYTIRELGGAIFGDRRYGTVFIYHNGAESYYASRGFRTKLII